MDETLPGREERTSTATRDHSSTASRIEHVGGSGIYPASGPHPGGAAELRGQGELGHPDERRSVRLLPGGRESALPLLLGRALLGGFVLYNGLNHFLNREMLIGYARSKGVPAPALAVTATGAMLVAGGLSTISGIRPSVGAALSGAFLLGVSPVMHAFWREQDPQQRMAEMVNFTKNMAILGGAMFSAAVPQPWPYAPRSG